MPIKVAINGFGRVGRVVARIILKRTNFELVAINSNADAESHAYLLKYDSVHGRLPNEITAEENSLLVEGKKIQVFQEKNLEDIPWETTEAEVVIDSTGKFKKEEELSKHFKGRIKQVVITCPPKSKLKTIIFGVNEKEYDPNRHRIVSTTSCTTMCLATVCKVLHQEYQIQEGLMSTVHAVTPSQNILDNSNKKVRRRRTAFLNIVPSTTGASEAIGRVIPTLEGKIECLSIRVPLANVSLIDLNVKLEKTTTAEDINQTFSRYSQGEMKKILGVAEQELVSSDFIGDPRSAIIDPYLTKVLPGNLAKVVAWYDNEWGYGERVLDLVDYMQRVRQNEEGDIL